MLTRLLLVTWVGSLFLGGGAFGASSFEDELLGVLRSDAGVPDKCTACQQLRIHGTARSVPDLARLLTEKRLGHAARYALEGLPYAEAATALRDAVLKTSGLVKVGLIDSLGWRRDELAVPVLVRLLRDDETAIATVSATALGRIATREALSALTTARGGQPAVVRQAVWEALLVGAESRLRTGDHETALEIYVALDQAEYPELIRRAAWRGRFMADREDRSRLMLSALKGSDEGLRRFATKVLRELDDPRVVASCLPEWQELLPIAQLAVLDAGLRSGKDVKSIVQQAGESPEVRVRLAAWEAVAVLPDTSMVPALTAAAARGMPQEKDVARRTLIRLRGPEASGALLAHLQVSTVEGRVVLLDVLGERGEDSAVEVLLVYAEDSERRVRIAALESLARLAVPSSLTPLLELAAGVKSESDRGAVLRALYAVCAVRADREETSREVISVLNGLPSADRRQVLPLLAELGTSHALATLLAASQAEDRELALEAVRVLSQWPTAAPAPSLLELAREHRGSIMGVLSLRGAIVVSRHDPDMLNRLSWLKVALDMAERREERVLALAQLGGVASGEALELALEHLGDAGLVEEAGLAAIGIAEALAQTKPELANQAAAKVVESCQSPAIVQRAWALRAKPSVGGPFIRDWLVCGPYRRPGAAGALTLFDLPFGPESSDQEVTWYAAPVGDSLALAAFFPGQDNCVAYLKAELSVTAATDALLLMGSDDGIKAWVNGKVVHSNNVDRGQIADQDMAPIRLEAGVNELLLKITQGGGGWSACARVVGTEGRPLEGLSVKSQQKAAPPVAEAAQRTAPEVVLQPAQLPARDTYRKLQLADGFYAEGACHGDFNQDGKMDIVAGPFWFEGATFSQRHEYRPVEAFDPKGYSDNFLTFCGDFNADGWTDILCVPFPGTAGYWYANPGQLEGHWKKHLAYDVIGNESPVWGDVTGDGQPELLFCNEGFLGYAGPDPGDPEATWVFRAVSTEDQRFQRFTHGVGFGDVDGDGRNDVLEATGWWEQPNRVTPGQSWRFHPVRFADAAAQMLVYDVDGDGLSDVITAWHCHLYGLVWWRQIRSDGEAIDWEQRVILSPTPDVGTPEFRVSQMHAFELVDMNGDGLKDLLTGKRFWAHGPTGDEEPDAPAVVFWLELRRGELVEGERAVSFLPHLIDDDSGVGTQVDTADLNDDDRLDVIVANKKGIFVHLSE